MHTPPEPLPEPLLAQVRQLIHAARQRAALAVNAELTQLYWHIGRRISAELLQGHQSIAIARQKLQSDADQ
jgi:hypothetical protein